MSRPSLPPSITQWPAVRTIERLGVFSAVPEQVYGPVRGSTPKILPLVRVPTSAASSTRTLLAPARPARRGRLAGARPGTRNGFAEGDEPPRSSCTTGREALAAAAKKSAAMAVRASSADRARGPIARFIGGIVPDGGILQAELTSESFVAGNT